MTMYLCSTSRNLFLTVPMPRQQVETINCSQQSVSENSLKSESSSNDYNDLTEFLFNNISSGYDKSDDENLAGDGLTGEACEPVMYCRQLGWIQYSLIAGIIILMFLIFMIVVKVVCFRSRFNSNSGVFSPEEVPLKKVKILE